MYVKSGVFGVQGSLKSAHVLPTLAVYLCNTNNTVPALQISTVPVFALLHRPVGGPGDP